MSESRRAALAARVGALQSASDGLSAELVLGVPSDIGRIGEAVDLVAHHVEEHFHDRRVVRFNMRVALGEALANAILYGNRSDPAKQVAVRVLFGRHAIEMEVSDDGDGFDPAAVPDPTTPDGVNRPKGRGIFLIRRLVDQVTFNAKGNVICMTLRRV